MTNALIEEREMEVLRELGAAVDSNVHYGLTAFVRPLDVGGSSRSHHSYTLSKLANLGLAESRQRRVNDGSRGSKGYTITAAGRALIKARSL